MDKQHIYWTEDYNFLCIDINTNKNEHIEDETELNLSEYSTDPEDQNPIFQSSILTSEPKLDWLNLDEVKNMTLYDLKEYIGETTIEEVLKEVPIVDWSMNYENEYEFQIRINSELRYTFDAAEKYRQHQDCLGYSYKENFINDITDKTEQNCDKKLKEWQKDILFERLERIWSDVGYDKYLDNQR